MKNFIYLFIALLSLTACENREEIIIKIPETKTITLDTGVDLSADVGGIFNKTSSECEFPDEYEHPIPTKFNVYFIPKRGGETLSFSNIEEGRHEFEVIPSEYTVVVTNSDKKYFGDLPMYSNTLYLFGSKDIDFKEEDNASVIVRNNYASIMVVKNESITSVPQFDGMLMEDVGDYYNIYSKKSGVCYLGINNDTEQVRQRFAANYVHRFMLCPKSGLTIVVQDDIFKYTHDTYL